MRKIFRKFNSFEAIIIVFSIFFSIIIILSAPALFNYKKLQSKIENQIESNYKFKINKINGIKYRFFPSPHLLIENSKLYLFKDEISELKNTKVYISLFRLYNFKDIKIKKIFIEKANFNLNKSSFKSFLNHLNNETIKKLIIKKSKIFYKDENNNEVILISNLNQLNYFINKNNQKKLNIKGNVFDTKFNFLWTKVLSNNNQSEFELKFRDPTILIQNKITKDKTENNGTVKIKFIDNKINLNYSYNQDAIKFNSIDKNYNKYSTEGNLALKPFFFNISTRIDNHNLDVLIKNILFNYFNYRNNVHKNINGNLNLKFSNIQNAYLNEGYLNLVFENEKILIKNNNLNVRKIGSIKMLRSMFYEEKGNLSFITELQIIIENREEFYRRFSTPIKNRIDLENIFLILEQDLDNNKFTISNISFNKKNDFSFNIKELNLVEKIPFDNFQKLRNLINNKLDEIN